MRNHQFDEIIKIEGEIFREQKNRKTLKFIENAQAYFIKIHLGVGYKEILKNFFQLKTPVLGAANEVNALLKLKDTGFVPILTSYGFKGVNPATLKSYVITKAVENAITLEDFCKYWKENPPSIQLKRQLIIKIATISKQIHDAGINHRDFYICHFLLDQTNINLLKLTVIDWHRAQIRKKVPFRWRVKDIAGLYFSVMECGLSIKDLILFQKMYQFNQPRFWKEVEKKAVRLYHKMRDKKHDVFTKKSCDDNTGASR
jgi:heptose I phosphotransferase